MVDKALDLGITLIDTADIYGDRGGSEEVLGQILGPRRKDVVLATKFGMPMDDAGKLRGASRRYIMQAVEASLRRLKTDWIDLYQLHRPDPQTPIEETLRALDDLVKAGKVRFIGCSNLSAAQIEEAQAVSRAAWPRVICQLSGRIQPARTRPGKGSRCRHAQHGLGLLPYFPLASGLLTGKYKRNAPLPAGSRLAKKRALCRPASSATRNWRIVEALGAFAAAARPHAARTGDELAGEPAVQSPASSPASPSRSRWSRTSPPSAGRCRRPIWPRSTA